MEAPTVAATIGLVGLCLTFVGAIVGGTLWLGKVSATALQAKERADAAAKHAHDASNALMSFRETVAKEYVRTSSLTEVKDEIMGAIHGLARRFDHWIQTPERREMTFAAFYVLLVVIVHPGAAAVTKWSHESFSQNVDTWVFPMSSKAACEDAIKRFVAGDKAAPTGGSFYFECAEMKPEPVEKPA